MLHNEHVKAENNHVSKPETSFLAFHVLKYNLVNDLED